MSLYTQGFLRATPSGKLVGVLKYRDPEGTWRQVTKALGRDRAEAERGLAEWRARMEAGAGPAAARGPGAPGAGPTVEEAARACLASQLARGRIERSTHDTQLAYAERDLFGELGAEPLSSLTPARVQAWLDGLCARTSPGSAQIPLAVLSKAAAAEARAGRGAAAAALAAVEAPRSPRPRRAYLPEASAALLEEALDREWGASSGRALAARLALHAGLRAGECCALRWRDVAPGLSRLRVAASAGRSSSGCYLKGPKNASSAREMPVVPALTAALAARAAALGGDPDPAWFCCGEGRSLPDPRRLSADFSALCAAAGVTDDSGRRATFHQLRHTFATRAVRAGVDVRTLADLMGHARADVTLNVYAGSGEEAKLAAVGRLAGMGAGPR